MRILYIHQHFNTPNGAGGTRSYDFARALTKRGHQVHMVCGMYLNNGIFRFGETIKKTQYLLIDDIEVTVLSLPYSNHYGYLKRIVTFFRYSMHASFIAMSSNYDLIFATSTPLSAGVPGLLARFLRFKPFVFEVRDLWPDLPRALGILRNSFIFKILKIFEKCMYRSADACVALAPGIRDGIRKLAPKSEVQLISNGSNLELFQSIKESSKTEYCESFTAVYAGTMGVANGLDAVLDCAAVLKKRCRSNVQFLFIGDGSQKKKLQARARDEGLDNCYFEHPMTKVKLVKTLMKCDVGLMVLKNLSAFYNGTSPNKFFDYIAAFLPVLFNYPGWLADKISLYHAGIVVANGEPEVMADAIEKLADSPDISMRMGRNARKLAELEFDRKVQAKIFCQILERVEKSSQ